VSTPSGPDPTRDPSPWARPPGEPPSQPTAIPPTTSPAPPGPAAYLPSAPYVQPGYGPPAADVVSGGPAGERRLPVMPFALAGGGALLIGVIVVLVLALNGTFATSHEGNPFTPFGGGPSQPAAPPLAKLCPPPPGNPPPGEALPPPGGSRLTDPDAGLSYAALSSPWKPWDRGIWDRGSLGIQFARGYFIVTETYPGGEYLASVLSGKVPATVGDSLTLNLGCAGRQVVEDVRNSYYPRPNLQRKIREEQTTVGGRPAWVSEFQLTFAEEGLTAHGERVAVVLVDVGRPDAAVLYVSIPETHAQLNPVISTLIGSVRPL
jgi:hypothetical protein